MKFFLVLAATLAVAAAGTVHPALLAKVRAGEVTSAIIELPYVADLVTEDLAVLALSGDAKVNALVERMTARTSAYQAPFVPVLSQLGLESQQFWISNIILVKGLTLASLQKLASSVEGDFLIREEFTASINPAILPVETNVTQTVQWGVQTIRAPAAWTKSQGEGCVVGIIDTGVNKGHTALSGNHAGPWSDPYYNNGSPTDTHGHGSHALGSAVGTANGVGVAPGARWIGCRGLNNQGSGTEANLISCGQFMVTANPRANVVSNSWGGGQGSTWYNSVITSWNNAGMIPVFAIGNSGASCRSANSPGDQPNVISVGATTNTDAMASFSSRGRSNGGLLKPEVSAPGNNIVSCGTGANNYATMSGTSMATPHVAGAACIILSLNPTFTREQVYAALRNSAAKPTLTAADRNCGLEGTNDYPNQAYGWGRIDIGKAVGA